MGAKKESKRKLAGNEAMTRSVVDRLDRIRETLSEMDDRIAIRYAMNVVVDYYELRGLVDQLAAQLDTKDAEMVISAWERTRE